ncbi:uncharacterized protein LOC142017799 [Carettochelys insculpta]|uniref:uncharacterized protein LOC142017799 n=1 Tax=Carettochelys insculpta TaxID=44489 RepID=UPI003EC08C7B
MGRAGAGREWWRVTLWGRLLLAARIAIGTVEEACSCSPAWASSGFQAGPHPGACCWNVSGTDIGSLDWSLFGRVPGLRELHLSRCGILDIVNVTDAPIGLEILHLDHNRLEKLPDSFLKDAPQLRVVRLDNNKLRALPESFLRASTQIQELNLEFNNLASLPSSIFKPSLTRLSLSNNSWDCTCTLLSELQRYPREPAGGDTQGPSMVCEAPERYRGLDIRDIHKQELCRPHSLIALFICLPLAVVFALAAWCFCRQKRKTGYALSRGPECPLASVERKGPTDHRRYLQSELPTAPAESEENVLLRNQLLLKPPAALLGSNRDLYEEVEIKAGALEDSLVLVNEGSLRQGMEPRAATGAEELAGSEPDPETVSVTEVLKDSVDREKLYLSQAVEYYNLVPAIELEDSDQPEYENIDLQ